MSESPPPTFTLKGDRLAAAIQMVPAPAERPARGFEAGDEVKESDNWATPRWLLQLMFADGCYFDPCPIDGKDGLTREWPTDKPAYINPPFSDPLPWVRRASGHAGPVVMLLPVDPTTKWWTFSDGFEVILIGSRLHFNESATYARQTLCIWRKGMAA